MTRLSLPTASDVFVSYAHTDKNEVQIITQALCESGLQVWIDEESVRPFETIQRSIEYGLTNSKVFLAYYSSAYPASRACQWELTAAFISAQAEGDPRRRILIINPEGTFNHVLPGELLDARAIQLKPSTSEQLVQELSLSVKQVADSLKSKFGEIRKLSPPPWWGRNAHPIGSTRFVGRLHDMWRIHSILLAADLPLVIGGSPAGQVRGLGGIGKSLLAEEYARRFGATYPGGVFWLQCHGNDDSKLRMSAEEREADRIQQYRDFLESMDVKTEGASTEAVENLLRIEIGRRNQPCLWIADDVPASLSATELRRWMSPHPLAKCLLTTRSREYSVQAQAFELGVLSTDEALELLEAHLGHISDEDRHEAEALVSDLGHHALAVDVAGGALSVWRGLKSIKQFRAELATPDKDALEIASGLANVLPNGYQASIAQALLHGIRQAGPSARDFLRLASVLAVAPIKPAFVCSVFEKVDRLSHAAALDRLQVALRDLDRLSLVDAVPGTDGARTVHTLVSRVMRHIDSGSITDRLLKRAGRRREVLRRAAVEQIIADLQKATDAPSTRHEMELALHHARDLATRPTELPEPELAGSLAEYDSERGVYESARSLLEYQHSVYVQRYGPDDRRTLNVRLALCAVYMQWGAADIAEEMARQLATQCEALCGGYDDLTLLARHAAAQCCRSLQRMQEAKEEQMKVLAAVEAKKYSYLTVADVQLNLAETLLALGELEDAEKLQRTALAEHTRLLGPEHPTTLLGRNNLAVILGRMGKFDEEEETLTHVLEFRERLFGIEHPQTSVVAQNLTIALVRRGCDTKAAEIIKKYLSFLLERKPETLGAYQYSIRQWLIDPSHYDLLAAYTHVSNVLKSSEKAYIGNDGQDTREVDRALDLFVKRSPWSLAGILHVWRFMYAQPATVIRQLSEKSGSDIRVFGVKGLTINICLILLLTIIENVFGISELSTSWLGFGAWYLLLGSASGLIVMAQSIWLIIPASLFRKRRWWWAAATILSYIAALELLSRYAQKPVALTTSAITAVAGGIFWGIVFGFSKLTSSRLATILISVILCLLVIFFGNEPTWRFKYVSIIGILVGFLRLYYLPVHSLFTCNFFPKKWYQYHPVLWDHLIRFPLIGLDKFLINYARSFPSKGDEAIQRLLSGDASQRSSALRARLALALENWL